MKHKMYKIIDLFCGAGGFTRGFEDSGHNTCVGVIDNNLATTKTHDLNFKSSVSICEDIRLMPPEKFHEIIGHEQVDVVIGGPPCPTFSTIRSCEDSISKQG